jgi:hypothetical protein
VIILGLALLHIPLHWDWIVKMTRTGLRTMVGKSKLNNRSKFNLGINVLIGLSGLICGLSGLFFLFFLEGETILFTSYIWDVIHTWSGVIMIASAILHLEIHWKWISKVFLKYWKALLHQVNQDRVRQVRKDTPVVVENN